MDTEITLDLNKPLFSYSRYEINDHGYGDDFIHRDGDGVNMQVFFDRATGEFVSKSVSISDFTNLIEGKSALSHMPGIAVSAISTSSCREQGRNGIGRMLTSRLLLKNSIRLPRRGSVRKCNQRRDSMQKRLASMKR